MSRTFHPRPFRRSFDDVPRHWFGDNAVATQLVNGINLLFPSGERFFVKSVRRFEKRIEDPELKQQIRAFYAQEGRHANAHERWFESMRAQGYDFDWALRLVDRLLHQTAPKLQTPVLDLSITVALEHYTAVMAELVFVDPFFQRIQPTMKELLSWHAAEEIEHKAVAFDVLKQVDPRYATRMAGFAVATIGLAIVWARATTDLLRQDRLPARRVLRDAVEVMKNGVVGRKIFWNALRTYLPLDFHPLQKNDWPLVEAFLERFEQSLEAA